MRTILATRAHAAANSTQINLINGNLATTNLVQTSNRGVSAIGSSAAAGEAAAASSLRRCRFNDKRGSHSRHGPIRGSSRNGLRMDYENRVYTMLADHGRFHKSHSLASLAVSALSCNTHLGGFLLRLKTTLVDQTSEGPSSRCTTAPSSRRNSAASHSFDEPGDTLDRPGIQAESGVQRTSAAEDELGSITMYSYGLRGTNAAVCCAFSRHCA